MPLLKDLINLLSMPQYSIDTKKNLSDFWSGNRNPYQEIDDISTYGVSQIDSRPIRMLLNTGLAQTRSGVMGLTGIRDLVKGLEQAGSGVAQGDLGETASGYGTAGLGGLQLLGAKFRFSPFGQVTTLGENLAFGAAKRALDKDAIMDSDLSEYAKDYFLSDTFNIQNPAVALVMDVGTNLLLGKMEDRVVDVLKDLRTVDKIGKLVDQGLVDQARFEAYRALSGQSGGIGFGADVGKGASKADLHDRFVELAKKSDKTTGEKAELMDLTKLFSKYADTDYKAYTDMLGKANKTDLDYKIMDELTQKYPGDTRFQAHQRPLTLKTLDRLGEENREVSKQYILDWTNKGDIKQAERDMLREALDEIQGNKVNIGDFKARVGEKLLPLSFNFDNRYESYTLPDSIRGDVQKYGERIYESPIETSGSHAHFSSGDYPNYFAHTRWEDTDDGATRRINEIQSDLFQRGRFGREMDLPEETTRELELERLEPYKNDWWKRIIREEVKNASLEGKEKLQIPTGDTIARIEGYVDAGERGIPENTRVGDIVELFGRDYRVLEDTGNGYRVALNYDLNRLSSTSEFDADAAWQDELDYLYNEILYSPRSYLDELKEAVGDEEAQKIVSDLEAKPDDYSHMEDAVEKVFERRYEDYSRDAEGFAEYWNDMDTGTTAFPLDNNNVLTFEDNRVEMEVVPYGTDHGDELSEVDPEDLGSEQQRVYKFYEKDIPRFLKKEYPNMSKVTDDNSVTWWELPINKLQGRQPIEALGILPLLVDSQSQKKQDTLPDIPQSSW